MTQFSIDLSFRDIPVPITGQSLAVLVVAALLGVRNGGMAIALYLLLGGVGMPVFANGAGGWETFEKGSGGFLYGFLIGGMVTGALSQRWGIALFSKNVLLMGIGTMIIISSGLSHLTVKYGFEKALEYGFYPFWPGAILKIIFGASILSGQYWLSKK